MRLYNGKIVELLAPVSNFSELDKILNTKCDAVYLGGKNFNMRMHSSRHNFTNDEINQAVKLAHEKSKLVYVTVNIIIEDSEIEDLITYLKHLESANVDAIIIQDYGLIELIQENNINLEFHSSVKMNVHNQEEIKVLKESGLTRFVASDSMSLKKINELNSEADLEIECFISGDVCAFHGGTCHSSVIAFNRSANKGQCFKTCRWEYSMQQGGNLYPTKYYLSSKDIDLINNIDQLIKNNVNSFKIEGRRKPVDDVVNIINLYADVIDTYIKEGKLDKELDISDYYVRDITSGHAIENPHLEIINSKNEDKHRKFSKAGREILINDNLINNLEKLLVTNSEIKKSLDLAIRVQNKNQAMVAINNGVAYVDICLESFNQGMISINDINEIISSKKNSAIYLVTPQMCFKETDEIIEELLENVHGLDGLVVSNLGYSKKYSDKYKIRTLPNVKAFNNKSVEFIKKHGVSGISMGFDANYKQLSSVLLNNINCEMLAYGRPTIMYSEIDFHLHLKEEQPIGKKDNQKFTNDVLVFVDKIGNEHPVYKDCFNKTHILTTNKFNILPVLKHLYNVGLNTAVIDGRFEEEKKLNEIIQEFNNAINNIDAYIYDDKKFEDEDYILGTLSHYKEYKKFVLG